MTTDCGELCMTRLEVDLHVEDVLQKEDVVQIELDKQRDAVV